MIRRSCLAGIVLSYLPALAWLAVIGAATALTGTLRTTLWLAGAGLLGYAYMVGLSRGQRLQGRGTQVTAADQPALMAAVDDVMGRAGVRRLDGVWLQAGGNAWAVSGRRDWLGRRRVGLGIGLLTAAHLSAEELRAILAHEAGHLADPNRSRHFLGTRRAYARRKLQRKPARPLWWFWRWMLKVTREQGLAIELHADAVAIELYGEEVAQRAHYRVAEAEILHGLAMRGLARPAWKAGLAPDSLFGAYLAIWTKAADRIEKAVTATMNEAAAPQDTHPGLAERCGGRHFPLSPHLCGDLQLIHLEELDRRCTAKLTQHNCLYPVRTLPWAEIGPALRKAAADAAATERNADPLASSASGREVAD